jgi:hypothetical protein
MSVALCRPFSLAAAAAAAAAAASAAKQAVLVPSEQLPEDAPTIRGYDFNQGCDLDGLMESMLRTGLQATALGQAIAEVNRMVRRRRRPQSPAALWPWPLQFSARSWCSCGKQPFRVVRICCKLLPGVCCCCADPLAAER